MAVFTPRGLKLRLPTPYAFALIARVYPKTDAFRVLQTTEAVENLGALATILSALAAFSLRLTPVQIGIVVFAAVSVMRVVHLLGLFIPPVTLLLPVSRVYGVLRGYGVLLIGLLAFGLFQTGWAGVAGFVVGRLVSGAVFWIVEWQYSSHVHRKTGIYVSPSERSFFNAYRLEAKRLGVSTDITVTDDELATANWGASFEDLASKWPEVVGRFTVD